MPDHNQSKAQNHEPQNKPTNFTEIMMVLNGQISVPLAPEGQVSTKSWHSRSIRTPNVPVDDSEHLFDKHTNPPTVQHSATGSRYRKTTSW